ncbi:MAG: hypothetical protein FIB08_06125 [Candidatus Methanoperedens sp.]|nr:hypothetical protein [Candidatus Methanoperedens sp.]
MNSEQEITIKNRPPWHPYVIGVVGLIFGPISAGLVTYVNFKIFGSKIKAILTLILSFVYTTLLIIMLSLLPERGAKDLGTVASGIVTPILFMTIQWYDYENWRRKYPGVKTYNAWKTIGWCVVGTVAYFIMAFSFAIVVPM